MSGTIRRWWQVAAAMLLLALALAGPSPAQAADAAVLVDDRVIARSIGQDVAVHVDTTRTLGIDDVIALPEAAFGRSARPVPNYSFSPHTYWFRLRVQWGPRAQGRYVLAQEYPLSDFLTLYRPGPDGRYLGSETGDQYVFAQRELPVRAFAFLLEAKPGTTETYYVSLHGSGALTLDLHLYDSGSAQAASETRHLLYGLFYGGLATLLLYNLLLFRSLRERVFLYYVACVACLGATFFDLNGLAFRYWWPDVPAMNTGFLVFSFISLHALLQFARTFLDLRTHAILLDRLFVSAQALNGACFLALAILPVGRLYAFTQVVAVVVAVLVLVAGIACRRRGVRSTGVFTLATGAYMAGMLVYAAQNFGWIGASLLASHAVQVGSAIEMALFSLALTDRVRQVRSERQAIAAEAHRQLVESHQQLERRVLERTGELMTSLDELNRKHERLIAAQQQLVQAEKMSSLGGLVAGVAHEINNPANFTRIAAENIGRDMSRLQDFLRGLADPHADAGLLTELDARFTRLRDQLSLIHDGTGRLARIVGDLRLFSRQDDSTMQVAAPDEGLSATLNLVRAQYGGQVDIRLVQQDHEAVGHCNPASLNQVFMNLAVNACQAILADPARAGRPAPLGELRVTSRIERVGDRVTWVAEFRDNGPGIAECALPHVFEPFFTTKPVGQGTGLGLSVSYGIIQKHGGEIRLSSHQGTGACFTVSLPLVPSRSP